MRSIGIVANSTWNIYNFRRPILRILKRHDWQVTLFAAQDEYLDKIPSTEYDDFIDLPHLKGRGTDVLEEVKLIQECSQLFRACPLSILLTFTIKPNMYVPLMSRGSTPVIATVTGLGSAFLNRSWYSSIVFFLYKKACKYCHRVVFHNEEDQKEMIKKGFVNEYQSLIIPGSGVDTQYFTPDLQRNTTKPFRFLFLGRLVRDKGIKEYLEAMEVMKEKGSASEFWIAGKIEDKNASGDLLSTLDKFKDDTRVNYLGHVGDSREVLKSCDCLVLPSYREGLSRAVLEAMAMGLPVITTNVPGCRELIEHNKNGYLVPARNTSALIQAMKDIQSLSRREIQSMGQHSRKMVVENYDEDIISARYLEMINEVMGSE
ncbi:MAG: glycosyltransferase family 4 protein [Saprospiraceae bacterium]|nr:glycosyltransferase family 4 protein [Saprospiraceae bacterium]